MTNLTQGHNILLDAVVNTVERVQHLENQKAAIADDLKEVYAEAKEAGINVKVLKKVIRELKRPEKERLEEEDDFNIYMDIVKGQE